MKAFALKLFHKATSSNCKLKLPTLLHYVEDHGYIAKKRNKVIILHHTSPSLVFPAGLPVRLLHDLLSSPIPRRYVWSGITGHNLTPEKRDREAPHPVTPTSCLRTKFNL